MTPLLLKLIACAAMQTGLDPYVVSAVVETESTWNSAEVGAIGEIGLMQLRPRYHGAPWELKDPKINIDRGTKYLRQLKKQCEDISKDSGWEKGFVICFNTGPTAARRLKNPADFSYLVKVKRTYEQHKTQELFKNYRCD